jgi:hypothetical protein
VGSIPPAGTIIPRINTAYFFIKKLAGREILRNHERNYNSPATGSRLKDAFRTHDFDDLKLLAGMEPELSANRPAFLSNWSIATKWKPELRYEPLGSYDRVRAEEILDAIRAKPDGVLECISSRW